MEKTQKIHVLATVWKHWKPSFKKNKWGLIVVLLCYNVAAYLDLMLKPTWWKEAFDNLSVGTDPWDAFQVIVLLTFLGWGLNRIADYAIVVSESSIIRDLKNYALRGLLFRDTAFFTSHPLGGLVAKVKRFASESEVVLDQIFFSISKSVLLVLYLLFFSYLTIPKLAPVLAVWVILFSSVSFMFSRLRTKYDLESSEADSKTTGRLSDVLSSVLTLRVFSVVPHEYSQFTETTKAEEQKRRKSWLIGNFQWMIQALLVAVLEIWVMYLVVSWIVGKTETIGTAVMVQTYVVSLSMNMWNLGQSIVRFRRAFAESYEMAKLLDVVENETPEEESSNVYPETNGIEIQNISFQYSSGKHEVIRDFSFEFESGRRYGLVGTSGSGKSTLVKLLLRFYDPYQGSITVRGVDSRSIPKDVLRSWISYVPQHQNFPSRTVREIICLGKEHATDEEVRDAAEKASCDFIWEKLEHGFDTHVGERGVKLSGGEAQRLAIAAVLLKDAPIVIMDEPTSALDPETEYAIQRSMREHFKDKTLIVIAHRLSTVAILDEVILMKHGAIVHSCPHEVLLATSDDYRHMWELQTNPQLI